MKVKPATRGVPAQGDHRGWIDYWHKELTWALEDYRVTGNPLSLQHTDRAARLLHGHAVHVRPSLKPSRPTGS